MSKKAVLVAISIPIFTTQLEKSREAVDMANIRAAYSEVLADYLTNGNKASSATVTAKQAQTGWQNTENGTLSTRVNGIEGTVTVPAKTSGNTYAVSITDAGVVSVS